MMEPHCFGDPAFINIMAIENVVEPYSLDIIGGFEEVGTGMYEVEPGIPLRLVIEDDNGCKLSEDFLIPAKQEMEYALPQIVSAFLNGTCLKFSFEKGK